MQNKESSSGQTEARINDVFASYAPESGCKFFYTAQSETFIFPRVQNISDEDLFKRGTALFGRFDDEVVVNEQYIVSAMRVKRENSVGGYGVTARTFEGLKEEIPPIDVFLTGSDVKTVAFLGNGMSIAPLFLLPYMGRSSICHVELIDMIDIFALHNDSFVLREKLQHLGEALIPSNIRIGFHRLDKLMEEVYKRRLHVSQYFFEPGLPHPWEGSFDRVVNCFGPNRETLEDQLVMLSETGMLAVKPGPKAVPEGFSRVTVDGKTSSLTSAMYWRIGTDVRFRGWPGLPSKYSG